MPLFEERQLQWMDIMERFEAKPHSEHVYNARGFIERLKSEGDRFLKREPKQLRRWHRCCTDLLIYSKICANAGTWNNKA